MLYCMYPSWTKAPWGFNNTRLVGKIKYIYQALNSESDAEAYWRALMHSARHGIVAQKLLIPLLQGQGSESFVAKRERALHTGFCNQDLETHAVC